MDYFANVTFNALTCLVYKRPGQQIYELKCLFSLIEIKNSTKIDANVGQIVNYPSLVAKVKIAERVNKGTSYLGFIIELEHVAKI